MPSISDRVRQKLRTDGLGPTAMLAVRRLRDTARRGLNRLQPAQPAPAGLTRGIERFSYFQGVLRIAGWVEGPRPVTALAFPRGRVLRL